MKKQSPLEEKWNAASHGVGFLLGFPALAILLWYDSQKTAYSQIALVIYGLSLILLFGISSAYHLVKRPSYKKTLRKLDHIFIYVLIAGSYTPLCLITLINGSGWTFFILVWCITILGALFKVFLTGKLEWISLVLYLVMGWLIVADLDTVLTLLGYDSLYYLAGGAFFYSVGSVIYAFKKIPFNHVIWHFFVLAGSLSVYFLVLFKVV